MLSDELNRPKLVNNVHLAKLTQIVMQQGTAFVVMKDNKPVGAIAGIVIPSLYNPDIKVCSELFWYVLPEFRSSRAGLLLLNAFVARGAELADETTLSLLASSLVYDKTLEKRGFIFIESGFIKYNKGSYGSCN
jgi:hypothetical protein